VLTAATSKRSDLDALRLEEWPAASALPGNRDHHMRGMTTALADCTRNLGAANGDGYRTKRSITGNAPREPQARLSSARDSAVVRNAVLNGLEPALQTISHTGVGKSAAIPHNLLGDTDDPDRLHGGRAGWWGRECQ
jgi:hypothetical protein